MEEKKTTEKINETKIWFFEGPRRLTNLYLDWKKRRKITKIGNARVAFTINLTEIVWEAL